MRAMYKPPITIIQEQIQTRLEDECLKAVVKVGIDVDRSELIDALRYDRNQYEKGYKDGADSLKWTSCETDLPERGTLCTLLYCNGKISGGKYLGGRAWDVDFPDQVLDTKVIAWMQTPQDMDVLVW